MINKSAAITLVLFLFIPICIMDTLNGFLLKTGNGASISSLYKGAMFLVIFGLVFFRIEVIVATILALLVSIHLAINYTFDLNSEVAGIIRILIFITLVSFFVSNQQHLKQYHFKIIKIIVLLNLAVIFINVFAGLFGIGLTTYGSLPAKDNFGMGYKGFFFAGNELGALLVCFLPLINTLIKNIRSRLLLNFLFLCCSILISTKTAAIGVFILVFYDLYQLSKNRFIWKFIFYIVFPAIIFSLAILFSDHIALRFEKISYFYDRNGIMYTIFTGRSQFIEDAFKFISMNFSLLDYSIGIGIDYAASNFKSTENDFIDLVIWFGMFAAVLIYCFYFYFYKIVMRVIPVEYEKLFRLTLLILFFVSITAGHVLTSGMILPFLSLYIPYAYLQRGFLVSQQQVRLTEA